MTTSLLWLLAVCVIIGGTACRRETSRRPPDVVIFDFDTLRADFLGAYGASPSPSPALDSFARESSTFEWAIASAPYTPPSQVSILTGLHPARHGVWTRFERLTPALSPLPARLAAAGYRTVGLVGGGYVSASFGFDIGFEHFADDGAPLEALGVEVRRQLADDDPRPLFLFIHTYHVHSPYDPAPSVAAVWTADTPAPRDGFEPSAEQLEAARKATWAEPPSYLGEEQLAYARSSYRGEIAELDAWFGALLVDDTVRPRLDQALVVVLSDHGEAFGEHGSLLHETLYTPVIRVPLMIRRPAGAARRVEPVVQLVDVMPTLLDLIGLPAPVDIDGQSVVPLMEGASRRSRAWSESGYFRDKPALLVDDYHLVLDRKTGVPELYAFRQDPLEERDLAATQPDLVSRYRGWMSGLQRRLALEPGAAGSAALDPEVEETLRSLGYIE